MSDLTPRDIYQLELDKYKYGLPLWIPEPAIQDGDEIRIGDVGYVDEHGQFHRFFNVTVDADHPLNEAGLPDNFEILTFKHLLLNMNDNFIQPGPLCSKGMESHEVGGNLSVYVGQTWIFHFRIYA